MGRHAEELAEKGEINASKQATEVANKKLEDVRKIKEDSSYLPKGDIVCEICGTRCNQDDEANFQAHQNSNLHLAYSKIREAAKALRDKMRNIDSRENARNRDKQEKYHKDKRERSRSNRQRERE